MSAAARKPTFRRGLQRQGLTGLLLAPPPFLSMSATSDSNNDAEHSSVHMSTVLKDTTTKETEDLGDQVVPCADHGKEMPVVLKNQFDEINRSPPDAPVFRYRSSNQSSSASNNTDRISTATTSNTTDHDTIVIE